MIQYLTYFLTLIVYSSHCPTLQIPPVSAGILSALFVVPSPRSGTVASMHEVLGKRRKEGKEGGRTPEESVCEGPGSERSPALRTKGALAEA